VAKLHGDGIDGERLGKRLLDRKQARLVDEVLDLRPGESTREVGQAFRPDIVRGGHAEELRLAASVRLGEAADARFPQ
jgi:hypothetical protein